MIDTTTHRRLRVSTDSGGEWSYIVVPFMQLEQIETVLTANKVPYWVDEEALSVDGKPEVIFVNFEQGADAAFIQKLLDEAV